MLLRIGFHLAWLLILLSTIGGQQKQNRSCKDIFRYVKDNKTSQTVGVLKVAQDGADVVELKANLSIPVLLEKSVEVGARLLSSKSEFLAGEPLTYVIYFPPNLPIPTLLGVELNQNYVCSDPLIMNGVAHTIIMTRSVVRLERVPTTESSQPTSPSGESNTTPYPIGTYTTTNNSIISPPPPVTSPPSPPVYPPSNYPPPPTQSPFPIYPSQPPPPPPPPQSPFPVYSPHPSHGFGQFSPVPPVPFMTPLHSPFSFPYGFQPYILVIPVLVVVPNFGNYDGLYYPWNPNFLSSKDMFPISFHGQPNVPKLNLLPQNMNPQQMSNPEPYGSYNPYYFSAPNPLNPAGVPILPSPAPLPTPPFPPYPFMKGNPLQNQASEPQQPYNRNSASQRSNLSYRFSNPSLNVLTPTHFLNRNDPEPEDEPVPFALL